MKLKLTLVTAVASLLTMAAHAQTIISPTTYTAGAPVVISSSDSLGVTTNSNTVTVSSGATVTFHSTVKVKLEPGFHASSGSAFYVIVASTYDADGDGIPDGWELSHGLNPSNSSDAQNATSGGLTYLLEYQLGTNPATTKQNDSSNTTQLKISRPN